MIDVRSFTISVLPEPEEIIIPDYSTVEEQQPIVTTPATSRRAAAKSYRYPNKVSKVSAAGKKSPVLVVPEPNTSTKLKTPSSRNARAKNRDPVKTKSRKVKPRQSGMFKRFTLLVIGYIRERDLYGPEGSPILLMLTMISVSQKTICLMWYWGSMSSALSLKNEPNLTVKENRQGQMLMIVTQIMKRLLVFQADRFRHSQSQIKIRILLPPNRLSKEPTAITIN